MYTPGPWKAELRYQYVYEPGRGDVKKVHWVILQDKSLPIDVVVDFPLEIPDLQGNDPYPQHATDARLIALAPELLEVCKKFEGVMYQMSVQDRYEQIWSQLPGGLLNVWNDARAALAEVKSK